MPIYLVRWPGTHASLIKAKNETQLLDIIDEVASPGDCTWSVFDGPLWIDFALPVKVRIEAKHEGPLQADEVLLEEVDEDGCAGGELAAEIPGCDTGAEMTAAILRRAFPHLAGVINSAASADAAPEGEDVRAAIAASRSSTASTTPSHRGPSRGTASGFFATLGRWCSR